LRLSRELLVTWSAVADNSSLVDGAVAQAMGDELAAALSQALTGLSKVTIEQSARALGLWDDKTLRRRYRSVRIRRRR
jgi:hypothetical protein